MHYADSAGHRRTCGTAYVPGTARSRSCRIRSPGVCLAVTCIGMHVHACARQKGPPAPVVETVFVSLVAFSRQLVQSGPSRPTRCPPRSVLSPHVSSNNRITWHVRGCVARETRWHLLEIPQTNGGSRTTALALHAIPSKRSIWSPLLGVTRLSVLVIPALQECECCRTRARDGRKTLPRYPNAAEWEHDARVLQMPKNNIWR